MFVAASGEPWNHPITEVGLKDSAFFPRQPAKTPGVRGGLFRNCARVKAVR
jgi:hypothetical protein